MISNFIDGVIELIAGLVSLLLAPIDELIIQQLPNVSSAFNLVHQFFNKLSEVVPFVFSYTGLTGSTISFIISLSVFILSVPILVQTVKVAIKWYNALKL